MKLTVFMNQFGATLTDHLENLKLHRQELASDYATLYESTTSEDWFEPITSSVTGIDLAHHVYSADVLIAAFRAIVA